TPTLVAGTYTQVAAGGSHNLGLRADGTLYAWGYNYYGQLGNATNNGTATATPTPTLVAGIYTQVAAGGTHSLGLRADGTLYAWGNNYYGQLGNATNNRTITATPTPQLVAGTYTQVAAGQNHSLGLRADGTLYAWGINYYGQLGNATNNGTYTATPTPTREATAGTGWTTLGTGPVATFSLVRTPSAQTFASAGQNTSGQLGDGTTTNATRFDRVSPLTSLQPLPVQLVQFTAQASGPAAVRLAWATASEVNSARFEVERSRDGVAFHKIGEVVAAGRSTTARTYGLTDASAPAGQLYYRLRQVDQDGTAAYSPVRTVVLSGAGGGLSLYPNPAPHGAATLSGAAPGQAVQVLDALGRVVATATADATGPAVLAGLAPGLYLVRVGASSVRLTVE
ncbi:MAG: T9SS type A sorting domain-containing protein, partial [Janthinobacterium lividum]